MKKSLILLLSLFFLSACSSLPESLKSDNPDIVTRYSEWQENPEQLNQLRLGGVIAKVTNLETKTRIEVVNLPINASGKPDISQEPNGRFVGYINGFVDPVTLQDGRLITVLGQSNGTEESKVGEYSYTFPVMDISHFHLWRVEERVVMYDWDSYYYPCYSIHCRDIRSMSREGRVIQEVK